MSKLSDLFWVTICLIGVAGFTYELYKLNKLIFYFWVFIVGSYCLSNWDEEEA